MTEVVVEGALSPSRKRDHTGEIIQHAASPGPFDIVVDNNTSDAPSRQPSEAPSTASSLTELTSASVTNQAAHAGTGSNTDGSTSAKKRKLTFAEREVEKAVKRREKEERERERAEAKALKDEEKRKKEEEKEIARRAKELAKAEKQKAEDAKKQEKEEKKKAKEQEKEERRLREEAEKLKKERSQMRIASFFGRPAPASTPPSTPDDVSMGASSRRSSIASIDIPDAITETNSSKPANPEFEQYIIPYFIHENTDLAPVNRWKAGRRPEMFHDQDAHYKLGSETSEVEPLSGRFRQPNKRLRKPVPVKTIFENLQQVSDGTTNLSDVVNPLDLVPYKLLLFREDVRPPYYGTYTKDIPSNTAKKMARNPTFKGRPDTNYDYDSEAEWEPPAEDDEEILDDEMSDEEEGEGEMEDFLDDDGDLGRRRMFVGNMDAVSSGLCWQGHEYDSNGHDMTQYRMDVLHDASVFPIDPYSTEHWTDESRPTPPKIKVEIKIKAEDSETSMPPPRLPLATVQAPNTLPGFLSPMRMKSESTSSKNASPEPRARGRPADPNKSLKMIQQEFLPSFKLAIQGSDLTKTGLIEILKKQFPKCSKDAIKDTLSQVAHRVGKKEAEKKWELKT